MERLAQERIGLQISLTGHLREGSYLQVRVLGYRGKCHRPLSTEEVYLKEQEVSYRAEGRVKHSGVRKHRSRRRPGSKGHSGQG